MPLHVSSTCAQHQEIKIVLYSLWYHHTYRCDDTRGCIIQFWPHDEHMCSKHVEAWNKLIVKQKNVCIKLVKYWDKYTEMHCQQNIKKNYYRPIYGDFVYVFRPKWTIIRQHIILKYNKNNYCTISCFTLEILILFVKLGRSSPESATNPYLLLRLCNAFLYVVTFGLFSQFTTFKKDPLFHFYLHFRFWYNSGTKRKS